MSWLLKFRVGHLNAAAGFLPVFGIGYGNEML